MHVAELKLKELFRQHSFRVFCYRKQQIERMALEGHGIYVSFSKDIEFVRKLNKITE